MAKKKQIKKKSGTKEQAWGVFLLGIGLMLLIAIATFDVNDPISLNVQQNPLMVKNWLGPLGAAVSYMLMQWTLGYPIFVLPILLILLAITMIRRKPLASLWQPTWILLAWALLFSVALALPEAIETTGRIREYFPSGLIGGLLAGEMSVYLGSFGSISVLVLLALVLLFISTPLELNGIFSRTAGMLTGWKERFETSREDARKRKEQKRILRQQKKKAKPEKEKQKPVPVPEPVTRTTAEPPQDTPVPEPEPPEIFVGETTSPPKEEPPLITDPGIQTSLDDILEKITPEEEQASSEFEVEEEKRDPILDYDRLVKESIARFKFPSIDLLSLPSAAVHKISREELEINAATLVHKLKTFGVEAKVVRVTAGPVITLYELQPAAGVKVNSIVNLANDLALAMEARGIRIIAPIPGKAAVGIEIPNRNPEMVYLRSLIQTEKFGHSDYELPLALGKTISGEALITDLTKMPHLLIAGATGSGKSVGINTIIMSLLYAVNPAKVKFMMVDPKKLELSIYRELRDHYLIWRPDLDEEIITKPNNAVNMLNSIVLEMEKRYDKLANLNVRNIVEYNKKVEMGGTKISEEQHQQLPYIVVIVDELADLMMVAAKEVETPIARLAQMARAVGIHLILATQRPSVNVITGTIKANFPARIAYQVATKVDSRTVLDMNGAEQLLGNGDMLFLPAGQPKPVRLQNPFVSTDEVEAVVTHIAHQKKLPYYNIPQPGSNRGGGGVSGMGSERDPLYEEARATVVHHQQGSISFLQRRLKIGYSRAARLMDELEEDGVVGPADGSKAREVRLTLQELQNM